jgi:IgGFc binding protein
MRKKLLLFIGIIISLSALSQDFTNKGKDFWVGYGSHCQMYNGNGTVNTTTGGSQEMVLYFATEAVTNITVSIPTLGYTRTYNNIAANTIFETPAIDIPKTGANDARLTGEGTLNKGIHIVSDKPVVAYAHIYNGSISGATILFPTNTLGKEYYSLNFDQFSNQSSSYCFFYAVATDTGTTTIEVTPSANTQTMNAGTTYTFNR